MDKKYSNINLTSIEKIAFYITSLPEEELEGKLKDIIYLEKKKNPNISCDDLAKKVYFSCFQELQEYIHFNSLFD